jgi:CBS domain-containing membrane protein
MMPDFSTRKALFCFLHGAVAAVLMGSASVLTGAPFLFPAFGATAFILLWMPSSIAAAPRSAILSHAIGASAGWGSARLFGLDLASATILHDGGVAHVAAGALGLGTTGALMVLWRIPHPPACATTLTFALGYIVRPEYIPVVVTTVIVWTIYVGFVHRASGRRYPVWSPDVGASSGPRA